MSIEEDGLDVPRELLLSAAETVAFPGRTVGTATITTPDTWRWAVRRAARSERISLLLSLHDELLGATHGGRLRLAAQRDHPREVDDLPFYAGDPDLFPVVSAAFALLPPVVRWSLQGEVACLGVGRSVRAWTGLAHFVDAAGRLKERIVVLGPDTDVFVVLHELGHVWTAGPPQEGAPLLTLAGEVDLAALLLPKVRVNVDKHRLFDEMLATALATCWALAVPQGATQ